MFLELFELAVYPATPSTDTFTKPAYNGAVGINAHALCDCDVTIRFKEGGEFTIYGVPLLAAQQFLGTCHHYRVATDKTNVVATNKGIEKFALWDSILCSLKAPQHALTQTAHDDDTISASVLEAVVALIMTCPKREALHQHVKTLREEAVKSRLDADNCRREYATLGAYITELEMIVNSLRKANNELKDTTRIQEGHIQLMEAEMDKLQAASVTRTKSPRHDNCPAHYDLGEVGEVLDVCRVLSKNLPEDWRSAFIGGMYLELVKYVLRAPRKNGVDDLRKAAHYINIILKELGEVA